MTALAGGDEVGTAAGEVAVVAAHRQRALWVVAVVEAHDHGEPLRGEGGIVLAGAVVGIVAQGFAEQDPAGSARFDDMRFAAGVLNAEDRLRIQCRVRHRSSHAR